jgi:hypothetical protein
MPEDHDLTVTSTVDDKRLETVGRKFECIEFKSEFKILVSPIMPKGKEMKDLCTNSTSRIVDRRSVVHCIVLCFSEDMKPAIRSKRRGMLTDGATLLHDISRPQTVAATVETIRTLKFELLPTQHTVQILPHLTTIFSDRLKMRYVDADL